MSCRKRTGPRGSSWFYTLDLVQVLRAKADFNLMLFPKDDWTPQALLRQILAAVYGVPT